MRRVVSIALSVVCALARPAAAQPCAGSIDGHVVDKWIHEPIAGAVVTVGGRAIGQTDDAGRFTVEGQCPGTVTIEVQRPDYKPGKRQLAVAGPTSVELELEVAGGTETIVIKEKAPPPKEMRSTTVLSGPAIERTRGKAFTETLAEVPGVTELKSATGMAKPIIRGQFGRRLLMLVDGVRHRAQDWGLDHAPEIDPFIADNITVVRGAGGVRYGPDAIGGAVLVAPPELRFTPGYQGEAHLIGASNGRGGSVAGRLLGATDAVPGLGFMVEGSGKRLTAPETPDYPLDNAGAFEWSAGAALGYRHGDFEHQLSYRHYQADLGVCTCLRVSNADQFRAQLEMGRPLNSELYTSDFSIDKPYQAVSHDLAVARTRWEWPRVGTVTGSYSFQYDWRREYDITLQSTTAAQFNFRMMTNELELVLAHNPIHLNEHWHLRGTVGLEGMLQDHEYRGLSLVPSHESAGAAAFVSERLVSHTFELEAGLRYDFLSRTASIVRRDFLRLVRSGQLAMDACGPGEPDPVSCSSTFHTLTATLGAMYPFSDALSAKLELSTASRAPNPDEQYMNGASPTSPVLGLGKPDLRPETTYSSSATVTYRGARVTAEGSAYVNFIKDYIYFSPALDENGQPIFDVLIRGSFPRFVTRPVDALFYGADGGIAVAPLQLLELGAQVSLVRARNVEDHSYLVFVPPDHYRGEVTLHAPDFWGLRKSFASVSGTYVTHQTRYDPNADLAPPPPAYVELGAEIGTEMRLGNQTLKIALQGSNLTNARYRDYTSLLRYFADEPGLQVWLRMSLFFNSSKGQ